MISRTLVALVAGCAVNVFAADPVVDKAVQDAQKKYPAGDYDTVAAKGDRSPTPPSFEIHAVAPKLDGTKKWFPYEHDGTVEKLALEPEVLLDQQSIKAAWVELDSEGEPIVWIRFTAAGTEKFGELTQKLVNQRMAILLEGQVVGAPVIRTPIYSGEALFTARSEESATEMVAKLNPPSRP